MKYKIEYSLLDEREIDHLNRHKTCPRSVANDFCRGELYEGGECNYQCQKCQQEINLSFNRSGSGSVIYLGSYLGPTNAAFGPQTLGMHPIWRDRTLRAIAKGINPKVTALYQKYKQLPVWAKHILSSQMGWTGLEPHTENM